MVQPTPRATTSLSPKTQSPYPLTSLGLDEQTEEEVRVEDIKRNQGMYITGSQGTGKSTLLETTLYQDFAKNYSAIVIDPHGQLIKHLIARMPEYRLKDTYLLDMTDEKYAFGLNMFTCEHSESPLEQGMVVDRVEHIFEKIFADIPKGLLLPKVLRTITLTFLEHQGMTLTDVHSLLHHEAFRRHLTRGLKNHDVKTYWDEYEAMSRSERKAEIGAISNRLPLFLTAPFVKHIVGQSQSLLNIRQAILNHEILLIHLPVKLLPYTAPIIGTMLIAYIHQATFSFEQMREEDRPGFSLVVDEFQNFATPDFAELFKEGRKYGARTLVANQDRHDLGDVNRRATLQAYTVVSFRTTPEDASDIAGKFIETKPRLRPEDIYPDVTNHLHEHAHPDVRAFWQRYIKPLQEAAEQKTRRYHHRGEEDEVVKPEYDFGAGLTSYDEKEVKKTLEYYNGLLYEAEVQGNGKENVDKWLLSVLSSVAAWWDFGYYVFSRYLADPACSVSEVGKQGWRITCSAPNTNSEGRMKWFVNFAQHYAPRSIAVKATDYGWFVSRGMYLLQLFADREQIIEGLRSYLAGDRDVLLFAYYELTSLHGFVGTYRYSVDLGTGQKYLPEYEDYAKNLVWVKRDIPYEKAETYMLKEVAEHQRLSARYHTPEAYIAFLKAPFERYLADYQHLWKKTVVKKGIFGITYKVPNPDYIDWTQEERVISVEQYGGDDTYQMRCTAGVFLQGMATTEGFLSLLANCTLTKCPYYNKSISQIWEMIQRSCDEHRPFHEARATREKLVAHYKQEIEKLIAQISTEREQIQRVLEQKHAEAKQTLDLAMAAEKARHDAFIECLEKAIAALLNDKLGVKKPIVEREVKDRILTLPDYHALVRIGTQTVSMHIKRPPKPVVERVFAQRMQEIQQRTHDKYCRLRTEVDQEIRQRQHQGVAEVEAVRDNRSEMLEQEDHPRFEEMDE